MKLTIIVSTYPDKKSIIKISNELVKTKIVACVNFTKISSIYAWKGKVENTSEYLALFKTTQQNKKILKEKIKSSHPYEVPEIAELNVNSVNKSYFDWIVNSTI